MATSRRRDLLVPLNKRTVVILGPHYVLSDTCFGLQRLSFVPTLSQQLSLGPSRCVPCSQLDDTREQRKWD
jgi:hypothetical protein